MNKVQEIHNSPLYGIIIETGCGAALSSALMNEPGASKTIYYSMQPYSKEYEHVRYGKFERSVSEEFVKKAVEVEFSNNQNINFVLATSWQLNDGDAKKYAHGWYALSIKTIDNGITKYDTHTFHFSIPRNLNPKRAEALEIISHIGINLLYSATTGNIGDMPDYIGPAILDVTPDIGLMIKSLENSLNDFPLVFTANGPIRFEELMRSGDEFIIEKGSFNPLHHKHVAMLEAAHNYYPSAQKLCMISTFNFDKPHVDVHELKERIQNIIKHGYSVIVMKEVYFYQTFNILRRLSSPEKQFYFPVGTDTMYRIYKADKDKVCTLPSIYKFTIKPLTNK